MKIDFDLPRMRAWLSHVFPNLNGDVEERALRFGEEAIELIQSLGIQRYQAEALIQQVYDKAEGEPMQELGGTMVTLASLCAVSGLDAEVAYRTEFERCERPEIIAKIKAKHDKKLVVSSRTRLTRSI